MEGLMAGSNPYLLTGTPVTPAAQVWGPNVIILILLAFLSHVANQSSCLVDCLFRLFF